MLPRTAQTFQSTLRAGAVYSAPLRYRSIYTEDNPPGWSSASSMAEEVWSIDLETFLCYLERFTMLKEITYGFSDCKLIVEIQVPKSERARLLKELGYFIRR